MLELFNLQALLTAELARALIVALVGAGIGAWAAQRFAAKIREREERLKTVRAANAAVMLAYAITEAMLTYKHQLTLPTLTEFMKDRQRILDERASAIRRPAGSFSGPVLITANAQLYSFPALHNPINELRELIFKQLSPPLRPFMMAARLSSALDSMSTLIEQRNQLLKDFRRLQIEGKEVGEAYYGLPSKSGADQRYKNILENLIGTNDDAIYFSKLIGDDLRRYTVALRETLPDDIKPQAPVVVSADFSKRDDVMPEAMKYAEYDAMFQEVKAFGTGMWRARFEFLALEQYRTSSMFPVL